MLADYFEPFTLLEQRHEPDGLGGTVSALHPVTTFCGALTQVAGQEQPLAGQIALSASPVLLHDFDVTLGPGDYVRRENTGDLYRITGRTADMRSPAFSGLQFAQVPVERVVIPC